MFIAVYSYISTVFHPILLVALDMSNYPILIMYINFCVSPLNQALKI